MKFLLMGLFLLAAPWSLLADDLKTELKDVGVGDRWIYEDLDSAKEAAAKLGKPIFALFR